jgi:hypothetical protein
MNKFLVAIATILSVATFPSQAMTADVYLKTKKLAVGNDEAARTARFGIKAYEQGLAEAFWLMAMAGSNQIIFSSAVRVCVPSPDVLKAEIVSSAINRIIGSPEYPKELPPDMKSMPLAGLAFTGLAQIFPCTNRE